MQDNASQPLNPQAALEEVQNRFGQQKSADHNQNIQTLRFVQEVCHRMGILSVSEDLPPTNSSNGKSVHILPYIHPQTTEVWEQESTSYQLISEINAECYQFVYLLLQAKCIDKMYVEQGQQKIRGVSFDINESGRTFDGFSEVIQNLMYLDPDYIERVLLENRGRFYKIMSGVEFLPAKRPDTVTKENEFVSNTDGDLVMFEKLLQLDGGSTVELNRRQAETFIKMVEQFRQCFEGISSDFCNVARISKNELLHMAMGASHMKPVSDVLRSEGFRVLTSQPASLGELPKQPDQTDIYRQIKRIVS
ncbi:hypothetical protein KKF55_01195 [Patescibacteria group bacterium]|nr:hypothetical protein [Patescibacteria group bacterium]